jgi:DNA-binding response OmpR family regulator
VPLKVLLVESRSQDSYSVEPDLLERGDEVTVTRSPRKAPSLAMADWPDLIIVNECGGSFDVVAICQALDKTGLEFPCLIVSCDHLSDYALNEIILVVPYTPRQFTLAIKKAIGDQNNRFMRAGGITVDGLKRQMQCSERIQHLTPKQCNLLRLLMQHPDDVLDRGTIMQEVWETNFLGDTRTLDVHIRWLREKLEKDPSHPQHIVTVRGVGYRFYPEPQAGSEDREQL